MQQPVLQLIDWRSERRTNYRISRPRMLGGYSRKVTSEGEEYQDGVQQLRVLKLPAMLKNVSYDLLHGYDKKRDKDDEQAGGDKQDGGDKPDEPDEEDSCRGGILRWFLENRDKLAGPAENRESDSPLNADFFAWRRIYVKIMSTPYENYAGWIITATKYKGTIYLSDRVETGNEIFIGKPEYRTDEMRKIIQEWRIEEERIRKCCYGGFRFEYHITEPADPEANDDDLDFHYHSEYNVVLRSRLCNHSLLIGAEMDCVGNVSNMNEPQLEDFVEIKTTKTINRPHDWENLLRWKMYKWWAQCYLGGTPTLVCGYRDRDMRVREIEVFKVDDMPEMGREYWTTDVCLRFLDRFLEFVKQSVKEDDPKITYDFYWELGKDEVTFERTVSPDGKPFISQSFMDALNAKDDAS